MPSLKARNDIIFNYHHAFLVYVELFACVSLSVQIEEEEETNKQTKWETWGSPDLAVCRICGEESCGSEAVNQSHPPLRMSLIPMF